MSPQDRFYQRLLAMDRAESRQISVAYLGEHSLTDLYSKVYVPALAAAEREEEAGTLDERRQRFIFSNTRELVEEMGVEAPLLAKTAAAQQDDEAEVVPTVDVPKLTLSTVLCLPAADEADEIVAAMVAQLLEQDGFKAESVSFKTLANEMVTLVGEAGCRAVCISVTPPHNTLHTRYLCKLLRQRLPELHIVVGMWETSESDPAALDRRRERLTASKVVSTVEAALDELRPFAGLDAADEEADTPKKSPALPTAA